MKFIRVFLLLLFLTIALNVFYRFDFLGFKSNFAIPFVDAWVAATRKKPLNINVISEKIKIEETENMVLTREILKLKKELEVREDFTKEYAGARVINFQGDKLTIDRGIHFGIKVGQKVIVGKSLIGEITSVNASRSLVGLLSNVSFKSYCFSESGSKKNWGVLTGKENGLVVLTKITQDKQIFKNDKVFCSGFYVGQIRKINRNTNDLFFEAEIETNVFPEFLEDVYIVLDK